MSAPVMRFELTARQTEIREYTQFQHVMAQCCCALSLFRRDLLCSMKVLCLP